MLDDNSIMKYESILPEDFDGVFRFSNPSDEDFTGKWNSKEYLFPAQSTVPMVMPEHSPLEIQHIRKKFAKDLAEREFYKTSQYESYRSREGVKDDMGMIQPRGHGMSHAGQYTIKDLTPFIQRCLKPLPAASLTAKPAEKVNLEDIVHRDNDGKMVTTAIADGKSVFEQMKS